MYLFVMVRLFRKRSSKKERPMSPTKVLLPPGEILSYAHDPVELRRLNFQTPGQQTVSCYKPCGFLIETLWFDH